MDIFDLDITLDALINKLPDYFAIWDKAVTSAESILTTSLLYK